MIKKGERREPRVKTATSYNVKNSLKDFPNASFSPISEAWKEEMRRDENDYGSRETENNRGV